MTSRPDARRRTAETTLVLAAASALVAVTASRLGLTAPMAVRAVAVLALAILPWGLVLTRGVGSGTSLPAERLGLAALVGYPAGATVYYLLARLHASVAFLPLSAVVAVVAFARSREPRAPAASADDRDALAAGAPPAVALALLVPLILFTLTRWNRAFVPADGGLAYEHSTDHSLHLSLYWELLRGVPARQVPAAAGVPFPAYHFLSFMPGLLLIRAGVPVVTAYHAVSPLLKLSLLMGAVYLALRLRTRDGRTATAGLAVVFLVDYAFEVHFNERVVVGPPPHYDVIRNEAEGGGVVVWAIIAALLVLHDRARSTGIEDSRGERPLLLACLLAGLSYAFKAQLFLLFGGALALALVLLLVRDRSRLLLRGLALTALAFAAMFWLSRGEGSMATVQWRPGLFAEMYIYPNLRRDPRPLIHTVLLGAFQSFPAGLGFLLAVPFALWRIVAFSPLVPAYVVDVMRRARSAGVSDAFFALAFVLAVPMGYGFSVVSVYEATSPFEFRQAAHGLALLGAAVSVGALHELARRRGLDAGAWVLGTSVAAAVAVTPLLARAEPYVPARAGIVIGPDEQCALLFLRHRTPLDAVVASARATSLADLRRRSMRLNHQAVVAGFAGRRSVLEFYGKEVDWNNDRERDLRRLFTATDPAVAGQVLDRYHVDYVLESDALPLAFPKQALERVFERGGWRIYRVVRPGAGHQTAALPPVPEGTPDDPEETPDDLRCTPPP